jgi:hypothetical protein
MRVKDAFDVIVQTPSPADVVLERLSSTRLNVWLPYATNGKQELTGVPVHFWMLFVVGLIICTHWMMTGYAVFAIFMAAFGAYSINKEVKKYERVQAYQHIVLEISPKGGQIYHQVSPEDKDFNTYYNWGELRAVAVQAVPKSKTNPPPYCVHLTTKGREVYLFQGNLKQEHLAYIASMIEALLQQRYRGTVPANWIKKIEELAEPLVVDWSEHLIDDDLS